MTSTMFALRATVHTTTQYNFAQLIFGRNSMVNRFQGVDWEIIRKQKQNLINIDNERENYNQMNHT